MLDLDYGDIFQSMNDILAAPAAECAERSGPDEGALIAVLSAAEGLRERLEAALVAVGLSISKFDAMEQLIQPGEPVTLGALAGRLHCVRSNVTQLVDRLEADGFVERAPDPTDRRSRLAVLTAAGRRAYERGIKIRDEAEREVFSVLDDEEAAQLSRIVRKLSP